MTLIAVVSAIIMLLSLAVIVFSNQSMNNANTASTAQAAKVEAIAQKATAQAASTLAVIQAEEAQELAQISRAGELAAQSIEMREKNFQISLLLGIEAHRSRNTIRSRSVLLDAANVNPKLLQFLSRHTNSVSSVAFSPDGKTLASGNATKIILWDVETHQPIGQPLTGHTSIVESVAFSPDGRTLASGSDNLNLVLSIGNIIASSGADPGIILWDVSPRYWIEQSCQRAGRNFTLAEWERYFPNGTYRKTCEQWPLELQVTATPSPLP